MEKKIRIRAYFCTNMDEVKRVNDFSKCKPDQVFAEFTGRDELDCEKQAIQYSKQNKYEFTGYDVYL